MRPIIEDDRAVFGALDRDECLRLLQWEPIGRLAVSRQGLAPVIVPINFVLDGDTIVFRTDATDTSLRLFENPASFQVDRFDWYRRIGWSVLVQGSAQLLVEGEGDELEFEPWAPGERSMLVRLIPDSITGRRIELQPGPVDGRGYL